MFERRRTGKLRPVEILSDVPSGTTTIRRRMEIVAPERDDSPVEQTLTQESRWRARFKGVGKAGRSLGSEGTRQVGYQQLNVERHCGWPPFRAKVDRPIQIVEFDVLAVHRPAVAQLRAFSLV